MPEISQGGGLSTVAHGFNPTVLAPGVSGITGLLHVEMQGWEAHINCAVQQLMLTVSAAEIAKVCWHSRLLSTSFVILTVVSVSHKIFLLKLFSAPCSLHPGVNCPQSACTQCHAALHVVDPIWVPVAVCQVRLGTAMSLHCSVVVM